MWFGTQDGVVKFDGVSTWTVYNTTTNPTLPHNTISAIADDADNNIWVGTDYGVSVYDGTNFTTYTTTDGLGNDRINHIAQAPNGDIWFGEFSGASVYNGSTFTAYNTSNGLPFGGINYVDFDSNGDIYMASGLGGYIQYDGTNFTAYTTGDGLLSNVVRAITVDASDNKWVGTANGISVFNSSNVLVDAHTIMLVLPAPDTLNPVEDIKINSQGQVWTGIYVDYLVTEGGVASYNSSSAWNDYDVSDGLIGPAVRKIAIDHLDNVWVGTSSGVSKISWSTGIKNVTSSNSFAVFPNPARDQLTVVLAKENTNTESVFIYNTAMQLVKQVELAAYEQSKVVSLTEFDKGIYFVKYGTQVVKVIVQ